MRRHGVPTRSAMGRGLAVAAALLGAWPWLPGALPVVSPALTGGLAAQSGDPGDEARLLREAASLEARGDRAGAEKVLRGLLESHPTSSGGLFALERVLRPQGRAVEILPLAERYLEVEPRGAGVRYLELRILAETGAVERLEARTERWIEVEPGSPDPFREAARIWEEAMGPERALGLLRRGQETLSDPSALALDVGDVLARMGRHEEAVEAWSDAIGENGDDVPAVVRRIGEIPGDRDRHVRPLVAALDRDPTTSGRRRAAVQLAVDTGLEDEALAIAPRALAGLGPSAERGFLTELARRATDADQPGVALWAYRTLRDGTDDGREGRALDVRIASSALAAADTALAVEAWSRLARALEPGSPERRRVSADLLRVEARRASPDRLTAALESFRREFPGAPELDELASAVAAGLEARGHGGRAAAVLEGVPGPRSAIERAFLVFEDGDVEAGKEALSSALGGLAPGEATEVIQLLSLFERIAPRSARLLASVATLAHRGDGPGAVQALEAGLDDLPPSDRPPLLAQGARLADGAGLPGEGARLRERLLARHPDAPERGEATLALARHLASTGGDEGRSRAARLLEELILDRPNASVVPDARRELERLKAGAPEARP